MDGELNSAFSGPSQRPETPAGPGVRISTSPSTAPRMNGSFEEEPVANAGDRILAVHANDRDAVFIQGEIHEDSSMAKQVASLSDIALMDLMKVAQGELFRRFTTQSAVRREESTLAEEAVCLSSTGLGIGGLSCVTE